MARQIAVLNRSTVVSDAELTSWCAALQRDTNNRFAAAWQVPAAIKAVPKGDHHSWRGWENVVMLDRSDQANALGYHELTPEGMPKASVFARTCYDDGASVTVCLSHEVYEMLADPYIQLMAPAPNGRLLAYENCDPVEADSLGVKVDGVLLSAFVYPRYFDPTAKGGRFDSAGVLKAPATLAAGGYLSWTTKWPASWQQSFADQDGLDLVRAGRRDNLSDHPHADRERVRRVPVEERRLSIA